MEGFAGVASYLGLNTKEGEGGNVSNILKRGLKYMFERIPGEKEEQQEKQVSLQQSKQFCVTGIS